MAANAAQPHWSPNQYRPIQEYTYKFTPNGELRIHVFFPFNWTPQDRRPGIVFFFGGGWNTGSPVQFFRHAMYLAGRGMIAASADYRVKSRHEVTPLACVADAKSAVRWLRSHAADLGLDPTRLAAGGGSAGAHLAACTAMIDRFDAAGEDVSISSAADALVLFNPAVSISKEHADRFGLPAEEAAAISPMNALSAQMPPAILFFGTEDRLYPPAEQFVSKAKQLGVNIELVTAEGAGHGFFNFSPWFERTLHRADEFLASLGYLSGPPTFDAPGPT